MSVWKPVGTTVEFNSVLIHLVSVLLGFYALVVGALNKKTVVLICKTVVFPAGIVEVDHVAHLARGWVGAKAIWVLTILATTL